MKTPISAWLQAFRLRTLPLALSSIGMGSFLALAQGSFSSLVLILAALTTIFLQVLSNLANDYGDSIHGADSDEREGPVRAVQSGQISSNDMRLAMILFAILSFVSGISLLFISLHTWQDFLGFLGLGLLAIVAAITYTAGKRPYGYAGLGDLSVFIFFGWVGVLGSFYLYTHHLSVSLLLPASSCGFFATAVLNLNNIRDIQSDKKAGKKSIPVRLGRRKAVYYHLSLLTLGLLCATLYVLIDYKSLTQLLFMVIVPLLIINARAVKYQTEAAKLDPYLKQMALTSLLFMLTFGLGQWLVS